MKSALNTLGLPVSLSFSYIRGLWGLFWETDTLGKKARNLERKKRGGLRPRLKSSHVPFRLPVSWLQPIVRTASWQLLPQQRKFQLKTYGNDPNVFLGYWESTPLLECKYSLQMLFNTLRPVTKCQWNTPRPLSSCSTVSMRTHPLDPADGYEVSFLSIPSPPPCVSCSKH